ncbi:MAG: nitroreductase family protein [Spirochaetaceae bacterium]|nr:nitroreductase family protein [Spirochaetaceae bacterium]
MKKLFLTAVLAAFFLPLAFAQDALNLITNNFGARNYVEGSIPKADIEKIVMAGVRAPSANNKQPWKFVVVQDKALAAKLIRNMPDGSFLVVIYTESTVEANPNIYLDCGLATENIYLAAQALGYGSRIYTGPVRSIDNKMKADLGIPAKNTVISIVRVGCLPDNVDAVSAASSRKSYDSVVSYK